MWVNVFLSLPLPNSVCCAIFSLPPHPVSATPGIFVTLLQPHSLQYHIDARVHVPDPGHFLPCHCSLVVRLLIPYLIVLMFCRHKLAVRGDISVLRWTFQQAERISPKPSLLCAELAMENHGDAATLPRQAAPKKCRILSPVQCWVRFHVRLFRFLIYILICCFCAGVVQLTIWAAGIMKLYGGEKGSAIKNKTKKHPG